MRPYCLSVMVRKRTSPAAGTRSAMRVTCTLAFSIDAQCRAYTEYCIMVKPSFNNSLRKRA